MRYTLAEATGSEEKIRRLVGQAFHFKAIFRAASGRQRRPCPPQCRHLHPTDPPVQTANRPPRIPDSLEGGNLGFRDRPATEEGKSDRTGEQQRSVAGGESERPAQKSCPKTRGQSPPLVKRDAR